ncbi:MAG: PrsW family intramembrane metalloprotease [Thermogemmatispora sp.]|uniref:PrsW family glutamic-type intramembrane protease n=1 Tax=Thermogemmatispora sp. TaxID=1968838 RepID=UPI00262A7357|nr:PrsW family glutamic-type intramembrane protease [Thermogemmatispora sp.]MBX5458038.1 PrsW family intramembrane metalloprotease [Thermogemmatispora sp.]
MSQSYGVLRVVHMPHLQPPTTRGWAIRTPYPTAWLPDEQLVHVLTRRETSIGRALSNDIVLMDLSVSREHARVVLDSDGCWYIINLTPHNVIRVNGQAIPSHVRFPLRSQDLIVLGSTMLQFLAPHVAVAGDSEEQTEQACARYAEQVTQLLPSAQPQAVLAAPGNPIPATLPPGEGEAACGPWSEGEGEEEDLLGAGVTMQFALSPRLGRRTRWIMAGAALSILAICALITLILNSFIGINALTQNGASSLLAALTIPLVPALGTLLLVNFIDRFEREPWYLRLATFLWGMVIAIPTAFFIERLIDGVLLNLLEPGTSTVLRSALQGLNAGFTEETVKGLGLLLLFLVLRDQFDNITDGIVYSAMIGAGFALVENFSYFATGYRNSLVFLIIYRVVLGWLGHPTFTACFGSMLGYTRHTRSRWQQVITPLLGYIMAVMLHSFFDFVDIQAGIEVQANPGNTHVAMLALVTIICDYIPPFLAQMLLLYLLIRSLAQEGAIIREFLASEVSNGVVTVDEYALLQHSFQRTRQERKALWQYGFKHWLRVKALYQAEIGLAFRKWHVSMGDSQKTGYLRQPEDAYRERIRRLRQEIRAFEEQARARRQGT